MILTCGTCGHRGVDGTTYQHDCYWAFRERGARVSAPEWQPIETAPKDGRHILVYFPTIGVWQVLWSTQVFDDGFWCVSDNKFEDRPLRGWSEAPTHWMPLPAPPLVLAVGTEQAGAPDIRP